jgi:hypothetical protein
MIDRQSLTTWAEPGHESALLLDERAEDCHEFLEMVRVLPTLAAAGDRLTHVNDHSDISIGDIFHALCRRDTKVIPSVSNETRE